jgi:23S rRNA (adenine2503-C2)-methyltransferase
MEFSSYEIGDIFKMEKKNLFGLTKLEIKKIVEDLNLNPFTTTQILDWLYKKNITSVDEMSNLSLKHRKELNESYIIGRQWPDSVQKSVDGTKKYLFSTKKNKYIETAYIPSDDRHTVCVSSQVGCKMGCLFCMTAKQGFQGQLTSGEILNQLVSIEESEKISNIVYMGMGEPFENVDEVLKSLEILTSDYGFAMSPKRITVSTIGIIPGMLRFLEESQCHLAISLHSPFEDERKTLMPVQTKYPMSQVLSEVKKYDFRKQRRIFFEYILLKDFNDQPRHVKELVRILHGVKCRVNLIRYHKVPGVSFQTTNDEDLETFQKQLNDKGILATVRRSRGEDIDAACGLLSTKRWVKCNEKE